MLTVEAAFNQHQHAKDRKANARQLLALQAFAEDKCAENDGKERLHLKHQRSQARRHTEFDGAKKKRKLTKADGKAVAQQQLKGIFGRATNSSAGKATSRKRSPASISGGMLCNPILMTTKLSPHTTTTSNANSPSFRVIFRP